MLTPLSALAIWCLTASAVMVKWQLRSTFHLLLYLLGALAVAWAGGPAGNLWALGLCVPLVLGWLHPTGRVWKICALMGGVADRRVPSALSMIYSDPSLIAIPACLKSFHSDSWKMTVQAAVKFSVGWMGAPLLEVIYPWALIALLGPMLYLLIRFLDAISAAFSVRGRDHPLGRSDGGLLLFCPAHYRMPIGYGRAKYPYRTGGDYPLLRAMEIPIAVVPALLPPGPLRAALGALC